MNLLTENEVEVGFRRSPLLDFISRPQPAGTHAYPSCSPIIWLCNKLGKKTGKICARTQGNYGDATVHTMRIRQNVPTFAKLNTDQLTSNMSSHVSHAFHQALLVVNHISIQESSIERDTPTLTYCAH
jgi:hypothetical protein